MVKHLVLRWPKPVFFMVLGAKMVVKGLWTPSKKRLVFLRGRWELHGGCFD